MVNLHNASKHGLPKVLGVAVFISKQPYVNMYAGHWWFYA